jgi:hypothetical protein
MTEERRCHLLHGGSLNSHMHLHIAGQFITLCMNTVSAVWYTDSTVVRESEKLFRNFGVCLCVYTHKTKWPTTQNNAILAMQNAVVCKHGTYMSGSTKILDSNRYHLGKKSRFLCYRHTAINIVSTGIVFIVIVIIIIIIIIIILIDAAVF